MFRDRFSQFHSKRTKELILWAAVAAAAAMLLTAPSAFAEDQDTSSGGKPHFLPCPNTLRAFPRPPPRRPSTGLSPSWFMSRSKPSRSQGF
jgi:hypothetical protein